MWSFWSRNPAKDFPYEFGEAVTNFQEDSIWVLQKGKKKATGEPVSIFRFEAKAGGDTRIDLLERAKSALKKLKTLRHPSILTYVDSLECDNLVFIVTEPVEPLSSYLRSIDNYTKNQFINAISYGLHQVAIGLSFLHTCNLSHNNMFMGSVLVNKNGMWRISGLEYVTSLDDESYPEKYPLSLQKYNPPEASKPQQKREKWSFDSFGYGCLIWEVFNGPLSNISELKLTSKIPVTLKHQYNELIHEKPDQRINPAIFVKNCRANNKFFKNPFVDAMMFIDEIQIKEPNEKNRLFSQLSNHLDSFPPDICRNKILPQLVTAFEFSNIGSAVLGPLLKIGKLLNEEEYQKKIVPCVIKLFACKDRATRAKLLQEMELFINYLQPNIVNEQVFVPVAQGFLDSNATIREHTVKCMLHLAPKLNYTNLNEEVLRHFARLQSRDEDNGIRTNTTVCLGKIACYLHPQVRQNVLIQAFLRSLRDPFPPARIAGILALSATQHFYSLRDTATRVMPALCHIIMDPDRYVRDQAFKALKGFISKLEKVSEDPSLAEKMEADLNTPGSSATSALAASWASWAVSALTSKFYRSKLSSNSSSIEKIAPSIEKERKSEDTTTIVEVSEVSETSETSEVNDVWGHMEDTSKKDGWDVEEWGSEKDPTLEIECKENKSDWNNERENDANRENSVGEPLVSILPSHSIPNNKTRTNHAMNEEKSPKTKENKIRKPQKGPMKLGATRIT